MLELLMQIRQEGIIINGMSNHISIMRYAVGDKLGHFLSNISTCFSGVRVAAICCWEVSLFTLLAVSFDSRN